MPYRDPHRQTLPTRMPSQTHTPTLSRTGTRTFPPGVRGCIPHQQAGLAACCGFLGNRVAITVPESQGPPVCAGKAPWSRLGLGLQVGTGWTQKR